MATGRRLFPEPQAGLGSPAYEDDRLSFTFPEIARQLRAHVGRQIGHILPEFLRPEERTALLAELESRWGFRRLDREAQEWHRLPAHPADSRRRQDLPAARRPRRVPAPFHGRLSRDGSGECRR